MNQGPTPFDKFLQRYIEGTIPWDDPVPPPEIIELADQLGPGRALDLGCGYGRTAIYLALRGWTTDGIDFIPQAIDQAKARAEAAGVADSTKFHVASATDLAFLAGPYDLAIDVGCMHSFTYEMLKGYRDELLRLLPPGALYLLFAHLRGDEDDSSGDDPKWIEFETIEALFNDYFVLERLERGITQVEDKPPWNSAWFWFRRR